LVCGLGEVGSPLFVPICSGRPHPPELIVEERELSFERIDEVSIKSGAEEGVSD
jgi:hypothetical protein